MSAESQRPLQLLAVVAHPHDLTHMGGTCAHHVERGDNVSVTAITGGTTTHNEKLFDELRKPPAERDMSILTQPQDEYADAKAREFKDVCAVFGISDVRVLPFADNPLEVTDEVVTALSEILYDVRPQMILTHPPYALPSRRLHAAWPDDHTAAGIAVQKACQRAGIPDTEHGRAPHQVAALYYMAINFGFHEVDVCIDITDQVENRKKAENLFTSQGHTPEFSEKRIESLAGFLGWKVGLGYAETFIRGYVEISRHLSLSDEKLRMAESSREEHLQWLTGNPV